MKIFLIKSFLMLKKKSVWPQASHFSGFARLLNGGGICPILQMRRLSLREVTRMPASCGRPWRSQYENPGLACSKPWPSPPCFPVVAVLIVVTSGERVCVWVCVCARTCPCVASGPLRGQPETLPEVESVFFLKRAEWTLRHPSSRP